MIILGKAITNLSITNEINKTDFISSIRNFNINSVTSNTYISNNMFKKLNSYTSSKEFNARDMATIS